MSLLRALGLTGVCLGVGYAFALFIMIASFVTIWRRGQRVALWGDEEAMRRAALAAGASPAVADELARGNKIVAIKRYRMETGASLMDAKNAVEAYQRALYRYEPWPSVWAALKGMR